MKYAMPLSVLTSLFFMWGAITSLNDILIPHLKLAFQLDYTEATLIQFTFFTAYFLMSLPSGAIVERIGYKRGIVLGLLTAGLGCLLFYPAAGMKAYWLFLLALFVLASGITLLQVSANPYVAALGTPEHASARLNLTQAFNSLGTTVAPRIGAHLILGAAGAAGASVAAVQGPYLGLAASLACIALVFALVRLPAITGGSPSEEATSLDERESRLLDHPHLLLGAGAIFLYVGGEVSIGSFLVNFMSQPDIGGLSLETAGGYLSFYWGGAMVGRFIGAFLLNRIDAGRALAFNALAAGLLVVTAVLSGGPLAMWALLAVGLFNSIMFPTIFTLGVNGLGAYTARGSGILCMAIVGGALVPLLQGWLADHAGLHLSFIVPIFCYGYIVHFGLKGHRAALAISPTGVPPNSPT